MDSVHTKGIDFIQWLQHTFQGYGELMMLLSHLGDPRNAFLLYFPVAYCLHKPTGVMALWVSCLSEWLNAVLKWVMHGERPYWWVYQSGFYDNNSTVVEQFSLTCETGPGSPSGHAMVTASVMFCLVTSFLQICRPRRCVQLMLWCGFVLFMAAACVSRCYIATHFPQQVILGTSVGILLTILFGTITVERLGLQHYLFTSFLIPTSCIALFFGLKMLNFDPQWSITMAKQWCGQKEWIHLDTTPFNSIFRDAGAILGFGLFLLLSTWLPAVREPSRFLRLVHIIMSLVVCQVVENIKPAQMDPVLYYLVTSLKFCVISICVGFIPRLYCSNINSDLDRKTKQS